MCIISKFIKRGDNTEDYSVLWNEEDIAKAQLTFLKICHYNQWDINNLVVVNEVY